jgi:esterase/lipase superfamily enzyme
MLALAVGECRAEGERETLGLQVCSVHPWDCGKLAFSGSTPKAVPSIRLVEPTSVPETAIAYRLSLFVTNRRVERKSAGRRPAIYKMFASELSSDLAIGWVKVAFPQHRQPGDRPFTARDGMPNPLAEFAIVEHQFFGSVAELVAFASANSGQNESLIYVHGFQTRFEEAAARTVQLAHDMSFSGIGLFFSWPSDATLGRVWVNDYLNARELKEATSEDLLAVVDSFMSLSRRRTHLIAHSMGADLLLTALKSRANSTQYATTILAAPDVDMSVYRSELKRGLESASALSTIYCSAEDRALSRATSVNGEVRLGQCPASWETQQMVDLIHVVNKAPPWIDMTGWHSYFAETRAVLADMEQTLRTGGRTPRNGMQQVGGTWQLYHTADTQTGTGR